VVLGGGGTTHSTRDDGHYQQLSVQEEIFFDKISGLKCNCQLSIILKTLIIKMIKISLNNSKMNLMPIC
jgi:hypothetical protein